MSAVSALGRPSTHDMPGSISVEADLEGDSTWDCFHELLMRSAPCCGVAALVGGCLTALQHRCFPAGEMSYVNSWLGPRPDPETTEMVLKCSADCLASLWGVVILWGGLVSLGWDGLAWPV